VKEVLKRSRGQPKETFRKVLSWRKLVFRLVELVNQSKEKDCEDQCNLPMMCIGELCGSLTEIPSYGQVPGRSVLSRESLRMDGYILRWPSVVLSWLRIGRYVADTIRQLP
jgi:hypothetical protein